MSELQSATDGDGDGGEDHNDVNEEIEDGGELEVEIQKLTGISQSVLNEAKGNVGSGLTWR